MGRLFIDALLKRVRTRHRALMTVHLLKLCVGISSLDELRESMAGRGEPFGRHRALAITTKMAPKRAEEVIDGGSLYWVVKGAVQARQKVLAIEPETVDGVSRTAIVLASTVVSVSPRPCRPFQGWRYLRVEDAPRDVSADALDAAIPEPMRRELAELCLI